MCQKQCRDENGFKCHLSSEGHKRQMEIFGQNPERIIEGWGAAAAAAAACCWTCCCRAASFTCIHQQLLAAACAWPCQPCRAWPRLAEPRLPNTAPALPPPCTRHSASCPPPRRPRSYSEEFESAFMEHLKRAHPYSRIAANVVYNEFINDRRALLGAACCRRGAACWVLPAGCWVGLPAGAGGGVAPCSGWRLLPLVVAAVGCSRGKRRCARALAQPDTTQ